MSEFRLSKEAEQDIGEMYRRGYWTFGENQADKFINQLFECFDLLAAFPLSGRLSEDIYPELRRAEFNPYVIFYLPREYGIYVLRLLKQTQVVRPEFVKNVPINDN